MLFASAALRLAALAARHLAWTPATFWQATPSELLASIAPPIPAGAPPTRAQIARMIERDSND
ncbi:MAG: phage tail assembly chaperone [Erythrobacter sp.]|jgi:hypothetical protein